MQYINKQFIIEKWQNAGFQRYFKNTGWMLISRIFGMVISFLSIIFIARQLGPENFGQLSYAVSFVSIFSIFAYFGIETVLYRDLIKYPDRKKEFLGTALIVKLTAGLFAAIITSGFAIFLADNDVSKILIFILTGTFIFNSFQIITYEFQSQVKSKYPAIVSILVTLTLNILKIFVVIGGKGVIYLASILLLESILYMIFYWSIYEKILGEKINQWTFNKNIAVKLLKDSWPLIFSSAFALVYARIDQVFIKHMIDAHAVGIYDSAVKIAEAWYFIPGIIVGSLFPALINAKKHSEILYRERLRKLSILLLTIATTVAIITTILAPIIIKILYGQNFMGGVIILKIYVWANIATFLGILITNYLVAENYRKILFFISFIPMIMNIILNLIWIPKYGIVGSAYATLISYSLSPLSLILFKNTRHDLYQIFKLK